MKYLALGDSYTIGEQVAYDDNFPNALVKMANEDDLELNLDQLIAVTGWTTAELATAIEEAKPGFDYDLVTLLIGVNNQYRGLSTHEYRWQFYALLCQAILFAGGRKNHVVVLSIPDWGLTPFNKDRDRETVSEEIDAFNAINREITEAMGCHYIDITPSTRQHANDPDYLATDLLHYSANAYMTWARQIIETTGLAFLKVSGK